MKTSRFAALCLSLAAAAAAPAQKPSAAPTLSQPEKKTYRPGNAWTLSDPLGIHFEAPIDTLLYNYQRRSVNALQTDAYASTSNLGGEGIDMIYFNRKPQSQFIFEDAIERWIPTFDKEKFYNVYIPMTLLSYNFGGTKLTSQDHLSATFAGNVNRRIGIGGDVDFIYSKGSYDRQAVKNFNFGLNAYYTGDRYEMQAFFNHYIAALQQNGGITDELYITDPAELQGGVSSIEPKSIPVRLSSAQTNMSGSQLFMTHAFKLGYWKDEQVNDTLTRQTYVPVTKFIYSLDYRDGKHVFIDKSQTDIESFWENTYFSNSQTYDRTHYWSLANTLGVTMIEGFSRWAKFGLAAYATYEIRKFRLPSDYISPDSEGELDEIPIDLVPRRGTQNLLWVGAQLTKQRGKTIRYAADARFGLIGDVAGEIDIRGELEARFRMLGDTVSIKATGFFKNKPQPWLLQNYISNNFLWKNSFGMTRSFRAGGELTIPWTKTKIKAGFENVQNQVYFGKDSKPKQFGGSVQIFSASLEQKLRFGIWNWNNTLTYQTSSNHDIIPLPALSVYSNMFLGFTAFKVLHVQFGVDCDYYTRYRGLSFQPATMAFHTQDSSLVGNFIVGNLYATAKLYKVRFYVQWSHINQGWPTKGYFSMPGYPVNPRRFLFGLSIDFAD